MKQAIFIEKCRSIFSDNEGVRYIPRQKFGPTLDIQRVALADAGETRIFCKPEKRQYADYQICFLMDVSGSMDDAKIVMLSQSVHAMAYALEVAGARIFGMSFNAKIRDVKREEIFDLKKLQQTLYRHRRDGGACNHDGTAIKRATQKLQTMAPSPAKILVVFSDGYPACGTEYDECDDEEVDCEGEILRRSITRTRNLGIELLGVGILCDTVPGFYGEAKSVVVNDLATLYRDTMSILERNIRRG